jgi:nitrogen-specific signal transduction histidine kinase
MTQSQNILEAVKLLTATLSDSADDIIIAMHLREIHRKVEMVDRMLVEQRRGQRQKITA